MRMKLTGVWNKSTGFGRGRRGGEDRNDRGGNKLAGFGGGGMVRTTEMTRGGTIQWDLERVSPVMG
jgi:hypothetical protein